MPIWKRRLWRWTPVAGSCIRVGILLSLSGCGGATTGDGANRPAISIPNNSAASPCANSAPGKVVQQNPPSESPGISFAADLGALGVDVTLTDLDGSCELKNSVLQVTSDRAFPSQIASQSQGFIFTPNNPQFQQVTTYYYANLLKNRVSAVGGDLSSLTGVRLDAHCKNYMSGGSDAAKNNAFYLPVSKQVCLGYTTRSGKTIYASDDSDVILHEFGHAMNVTLASISIMSSSSEAGAIDEAVADYWALTINNSPTLSEWFLGAIDANDVAHADPYYMRVATNNNIYPDSMIAEVHFDSRPFSQALWLIRTSLGPAKSDPLVGRFLDLLPATSRYQDAVSALQSAAISLNLSNVEKNTINTILSNKGLLRNDSAANIAISGRAGRQSIYVIDDHSQSMQANGNCNGVLDVGETALVVVNLKSTGSTLGMLVGTLSSNSAGITIPASGNVGEYMRLNGGGDDFVDVLETSNVIDRDATLNAAFLVTATSAGVKNFTLNLSPMGGAAVNLPFALSVGNVATRPNDCAGGSKSNSNLWPVP